MYENDYFDIFHSDQVSINDFFDILIKFYIEKNYVSERKVELNEIIIIITNRNISDRTRVFLMNLKFILEKLLNTNLSNDKVNRTIQLIDYN